MRKQHQLVGEFREDSFKHLVLINAASWTALFDLIRYFVSNPIVTTIVTVMKLSAFMHSTNVPCSQCVGDKMGTVGHVQDSKDEL